MDPFVMMLINSLMNGAGTNSFFNSAFGGLGSPMFNPQNPFAALMQGRQYQQPQQQQARPMQQRPQQQQPPRTLTGTTNPGGLRPINNQPTFQPTIEQPPPYIPIADQPIFNPVVNPRISPIGNQPTFEPGLTPPTLGPIPGRGPEFMVNLAGFNVPINMTGITGFGGQGTLPGRDNNNYLPMPPRGLGGMVR